MKGFLSFKSNESEKNFKRERLEAIAFAPFLDVSLARALLKTGTPQLTPKSQNAIADMTPTSIRELAYSRLMSTTDSRTRKVLFRLQRSMLRVRLAMRRQKESMRKFFSLADDSTLPRPLRKFFKESGNAARNAFKSLKNKFEQLLEFFKRLLGNITKGKTVTTSDAKKADEKASSAVTVATNADEQLETTVNVGNSLTGASTGNTEAPSVNTVAKAEKKLENLKKDVLKLEKRVLQADKKVGKAEENTRYDPDSTRFKEKLIEAKKNRRALADDLFTALTKRTKAEKTLENLKRNTQGRNKKKARKSKVSGPKKHKVTTTKRRKSSKSKRKSK